MYRTTNIGAQFRTGEKAPVSGVYTFVRHTTYVTGCTGSVGGNSIPLSKGERFPPHAPCGKGAIWRLSQYA